MFSQHDSHITDKRDVANDCPNDVLSPQEVLAARVELGIIGEVVVAFRQKLGFGTASPGKRQVSRSRLLPGGPPGADSTRQKAE